MKKKGNSKAINEEEVIMHPPLTKAGSFIFYLPENLIGHIKT